LVKERIDMGNKTSVVIPCELGDQYRIEITSVAGGYKLAVINEKVYPDGSADVYSQRVRVFESEAELKAAKWGFAIALEDTGTLLRTWDGNPTTEPKEVPWPPLPSDGGSRKEASHHSV
jgi:hypothetical protein